MLRRLRLLRIRLLNLLLICGDLLLKDHLLGVRALGGRAAQMSRMRPLGEPQPVLLALPGEGLNGTFQFVADDVCHVDGPWMGR